MERSVLIASDSTTDLSPELIERLGFPEGFTCVGTMALGYEAKEFPKLKGDEQRIEVAYIR